MVAGLVAGSRADTAWVNPASGLWRQAPNWSAGVPTFSSSLALITNSNTKTVTVDALTPLANLEVDRLLISAPAGQINTLLLDNLSAVGDFKIIGLGAVNRGGAIIVRNSTLFVDGLNGGAMDLNAGELTLESGAVTLGEFGRFRVGIGGVGTLNVQAGLFTAGADFIVGAGLSGGEGTVNLTGGELRIANGLVIADDPANLGTLLVNGGKLVSTNDLVVTRIGDDGTGALNLQSGAIEFWDVSVGRSAGSSGTWTISGGTAQTKDVSVGRFPGASGVLNITGGSLLLPDDSLLIGREGSGHVNISGGLVESFDVLIATNTASTGGLTISDGTLRTEELVIGAASGGSATVTLNGGTIEVNSLTAASSSGAIQFNGGTIVSAGTTIANGQPFVVGDGVRPAVFRLDGGTHTFQNGLVISANASVVGCGEIVGAVQNNGTLNTNCDVTRPTLINSRRAANDFSFQFQSQTGVNYTVEYKVTLDDPEWIRLGTYPGSGGLVTVTDPVAGATRFYRVVIY